MLVSICSYGDKLKAFVEYASVVAFTKLLSVLDGAGFEAARGRS